MGGGHTGSGLAVAVNLYFLSSLVDTYATHGGLHLLNGTVGIEVKLFNLHGAALVVPRREEVVVVEQVPLALVVHDAVVVGPAAVGVLGHDQSLVLVGTHRVLAHGVAEYFGVLPHVRIGEVVPAVGLEGKRAFSLAVGQVPEAVYAYHLHLAVAPLDGFLGVVVGEFLHVGLQLGTTSVAPEDVGVAVGCLEHARVDAVDALDRLRLRNERSIRTVGYGYTDGEASPAFSRSRREIEIVLSVTLDAVGCPHGIGVRSHPGHLVLGDNHAVVSPVGQVL